MTTSVFVRAVLGFTLLAAAGCGVDAAKGGAHAYEPVPTVTVTVTASPPELITLPDLVGKNGAIARDQLRKLGIKNIEWTSADPKASWVLLPANWKVTKQEPQAGSKVHAKDLVVLTAVKAK